MWTVKEETLLRYWLKVAEIQVAMHTDTCKTYIRRQTWLTGPDILFSTLASSSLLIALGEKEVIIGWLATICSVLSTLCKVSTKVFNYQEQAQKHNDVGTQWTNLVIDIQEMLYREEDKREQVEVFIEQVKKRIQALNQIAPVIPQPIVDTYRDRRSSLEELKVDS